MLDNRSITGRYIGLFLLGCFLFCYPVLTIFNLPYCLFGIPLFFFYLFTAWTVLIIFIIFCTNISDTFQSSGVDTGVNKGKQSG